MKSMLVGMGMVAAAASLGMVSCGGEDPAATSTPIVDIGATNFVTIPPVPVTIPSATTAPDLPGSILPYEFDYTVLADDYPSTVAARLKVNFDEFLLLNNTTLDDNGFWPGWTAGLVVKIPAGSTVPGEPPITAAPTVPEGGETTVAPEAATTETDPPESVTTTTLGGDCAPGSYTIVEGDYPGKVAEKFDVSVGALNSANTSTKYYSSFGVGVKIVIPAPSDC
jgi:LysM repeat protein